MTFTPSRPCKSPGCSALIAAGQGSYCPAHTTAPRAERAVRDRHRGTAAARGYDAEWQRYRLNFLAQWPICPGVLMPTREWNRPEAEAFHRLRVAEREKGHLLIFNRGNTEVRKTRNSAPSPLSDSVMEFLALHPIYRYEPWGVGQLARVVDHIIPHKGDPELMWAMWNHQPLTKRGHDRKTATEQHARNIAAQTTAPERSE